MENMLNIQHSTPTHHSSTNHSLWPNNEKFVQWQSQNTTKYNRTLYYNYQGVISYIREKWKHPQYLIYGTSYNIKQKVLYNQATRIFTL